MAFYMRDLEPGPGEALDPGTNEKIATGVPLRCLRPMRAAMLTVPTPLSIFGTLLMAALALPRGALVMLPRGVRMVPALLRMRHHRRA
jgi:hypothetical protein